MVSSLLPYLRAHRRGFPGSFRRKLPSPLLGLDVRSQLHLTVSLHGSDPDIRRLVTYPIVLQYRFVVLGTVL